MVKVLLNGTVLAECDSPVILEGNYYFPPDAVRKANLTSSNTSYYADPKSKAAHIKNHVAFYKVSVHGLDTQIGTG